jgi:predicted nucleic acid-binding protein
MHPKYSPNAQAIIHQVHCGTIKALVSVLVFDEVFGVLSKEKGADYAVRAVRAFFELPNLRIVPINSENFLRAMTVVCESTLKSRDAVHYACMLQYGISSIITADSDFKKYGMIDLANV